MSLPLLDVCTVDGDWPLALFVGHTVDCQLDVAFFLNHLDGLASLANNQAHLVIRNCECLIHYFA
jgi:hypothetical protein